MLFGLFLALASICFSTFQPVAQAATLSTLNFQARLQTNPGGGIVPDGYYNVEFKLYNASSSSGSSQGSCTGDAACLWTETWYDSNGVTAGNDNRIRVSHGYLTANLGSLTSFPSTINWDQSLYITMNIGGTTQTATPTWNGEMSPRLALTAVPYAFRAGQLATYNSGTGFTSTLALLQPTVGNQVFQIQDQGAAGTYNVCIQNSSACGFATGSGTAFLQNGNSFGTTAVLGANDANALQFKAGNATVLTFSSGATNAYFGNASATGTASTPTNFTLNGTGSSTAGTTGGKLTLKGGAGSSSGTGSDGGDVSLLGGSAGGSNARVGGQISITGGAGSATGAGGAVLLTSGAGGTTSGGSGTITLQTGTTTSGNTGGISLLTGNATGGTAGDINIDIGTSTTGAGNINIGTTNGTSTAKTITIGNTSQVGTIKLGQSTATNTIAIGNAAVTGTQTISIGTGATGAGVAAITLGSTLNTSATTLNAGSGNINLNTNNASGGTVVKSVTSNSVTAFQVQNASGTGAFVVDTSGGSGTGRAGVGLATDPPLAKLHLHETAASTATTLFLTNATTTATSAVGLYIQLGATGNGVINMLKAGANLGLGAGSSGSNTLTIFDGGSILARNTTDSTTAFKVQTSTGGTNQSVLNVDTTNERVTVGAPTASAAAKLDVYGSGTTAERVYQASNNQSISEYSATSQGAGTVTTNGTTTLTGSSTTFTTLFKVGDTILVNSATPQLRTISAIASNTSLTVSVAFTGSAGGLSYYDASAPGAGTVATTATSPTVTGTSTTFTTSFKVGDSIAIDGEGVRVISAIASNTSLTLAVNATNTVSSKAYARANIDPLTIKSSGALGVNVLSPAAALHIQSAGVGQTVLAAQAANGQTADIFSLLDSSANALAGFNNAGQLYLGRASGATGSMKFLNATNANTIVLQSGVTSTGYTLTLPTALSGGAGDCLKDTSGTGTLGFANCGAGVSAIGTIDSQTKNANGAVISGNNLVLQTADASNVGLVSTGTQTFAGAKTFTGDTLHKDTSTTAFVVQDAGATNNLIVADTTNSKVSLGTVGSNSLVQLTGVAGGAGSLQAFATNGNSLAGNRVGATTVTSDGYMYVLGGYDGTTYNTTVYYAKMNADGSIGAFTSTAALPAGRAFGSSVVGNNGYIYYMGGTANGTAANATVYYAKINADGTVGTWATDTGHPITAVRMGQTSVSANGYVYVIGGYDGSAYQATTYYAKMGADGTLGTWASTTSFAAGRAYHSTVVVNGYAYVIGGTNNGTAGNSTVYYAKINTDGTFAAWSTEATNTLPAVRMGATSVVANGYTYVLGGSTNNTTGAVSTIYYAKMNANGSVGTWSTNTANPLVNNSYQHASAASNGYVYIIGGWDGTTRRAAVYYSSGARLQVAASLDLIGSTQTDGLNESEGSADGMGSVGGSIAAGNIFSNGNIQATGNMQVGGALMLGGTISGAGLTDCSGVTSKLLYSAATQQFTCGNDRGSTLVIKSTNETTLFGLQDDDELLFAIPASETWIFEIDASINAATGSGNDFNFQITAPTGASCSINGAGLDGGASPTITNINDIGCAVTTTVVMGATGFLNVYGSVTTGATAGSVKFRWANSTSGNSAGVDHGSLLRAYRVGPGADYAENYFTKDMSMKAGDVVSVDGSLPAGVQKSGRAYQRDAIGVVSTAPGQVVGDDVGISQGRPVPIALNGRVPVKIADDSPEIQAGDLITASAQPGRAMKATRAGQIIGKALTGWKPGTNNDTVMLFMNVTWGDPNDDTISDSTATGVTTAQQAGAAQLNEGDIGVKPLEVTELKAATIVVNGNITVGGKLTLAGDIELAGHLITSGKTARIELKPYAGLEDGEGVVHKAKATIGGNDTGGALTITIGDLPADLQPGDMVKISFDKPFAAKPHVLISPSGANGARLQAFVNEVTTDYFTISAVGTPQPGTSYDFTYYVFQ